MKRKLYYISDLHLELRSNKIGNNLIFKPDEGRNFLALCGDIGSPFHINYQKFLEVHSSLYERIFIIVGNHEYYASNKQKTMKQVEEKIRELVNNFNNVTFLHTDEPFQLEDTLFVGCPLWTKVDADAERFMNDYNNIYIDDDYSTPKFKTITNGLYTKKKWIRPNRHLIRYTDILNLHQEMVTYLEKVMSMDILDTTIKQIIILTHHAPSPRMLGKKAEDNSCLMPSNKTNLDKYYTSSCEYLFKTPLICWISGHTHECLDIKINNISSLSNCYGYPGQKTDFDKTKCFHF